MDPTVALLAQYGYLILFPLAIVEGPIVTVIAGFFVSMHVFNPVIAYLIVISGDFVGDTIFYALGRWGSNLVWKRGHHVGLTKERLEYAREKFDANHRKTIVLTKLTQGIGPIGLIAAGNLRIPYRKYILTCLAVTSIQSAVFLTTGVLFGSAYATIEHYMNTFAAVVSALVLFVVFYLLIRKWRIKRI